MDEHVIKWIEKRKAMSQDTAFPLELIPDRFLQRLARHYQLTVVDNDPGEDDHTEYLKDTGLYDLFHHDFNGDGTGSILKNENGVSKQIYFDEDPEQLNI